MRVLRGVMPAGIALQGDRVYVTEAGIDAVAVIDTSSNRILGQIPVDWYPTATAVSAPRSFCVVGYTECMVRRCIASEK